MTPRQKLLVQATFEQAMPRLDMVAERFYRRLFQRYPHLKEMFNSDLREQGQRFVSMIAIAVKGLDHAEETVQKLRELGRRHTQYGVRAEHYDVAWKIFLHAVRLASNVGFNSEILGAWHAFYKWLVRAMHVDIEYHAGTSDKKKYAQR